ncbi:MAG: UDP-3-O-(3-hydroxymyristoyl) N-acetylglucosamine deacetylase [bacterium ADurb.Bin374]|nr:MAG: UDP-3-O-(3-hydroxymyristoyl) N-acetylglucosamine deacetylase [bacterium ADurb.Bin374]
MTHPPEQRTIRKPITLTGVGLHTGQPVTLTFKPADPDSGIAFRRMDLPGTPLVQASAAHVKEVLRGTTIRGEDGAVIHTVEHVMSALYGMGVDNAIVEIDSAEPPILDGSALRFAEALRDTGIVGQGVPAQVCDVRDLCAFSEGDKSIVFLPSDRFEITFRLSYKDNIISPQSVHLVVDETTFIERIGRARTFGFEYEFDMLKEKRLALGGSLENAVVVKRDGSVMNPEGLRDPQEFALHKILDLIGDLALTGRRMKGHIIACRTGHAWNVKLAQRLCAVYHQQKERNHAPMMTIEEIKQILPHRYPFLLVDRMLSIEPGVSAVGYKNVTANEEFFNGHFPQRPVMPGVLIVEAMAQVAGVLFLSQPEHKGKIPFFCGIDGARFRKPVVPGDRLEMHVKVLKVRGATGKVQVEAKVDGETVADGELMFTIV